MRSEPHGNGAAPALEPAHADFDAAVQETSNRLTLDALRESISSFVALSPFGLYTVDEDLLVHQASAGTRRLFKVAWPVSGMALAKLMHAVWNPRFADHVVACFRRTLATGERYRESSRERRRDMDDVQSFDWELQPTTLPDGRRGVLGMYYDLSERDKYEAIIREREARLRLAAETAGFGVHEYDALRDTGTWSLELHAITGVPDGAHIDLATISALIHPDDRARVIAAVTAAPVDDTRTTFDETYRILRHDTGEVRWLSNRGMTFMRTADDGTCSLRNLGVAIDITDRVLTEQRLRDAADALKRADESKDLFIATLAHELRNPLAPIRNGIELLKAGHRADFDKTLAMIDRQLAHVVHLVDDLLDVSRITTGKLVLQRTTFLVRDAIDAAIEVIAPAAAEAGHRLEVSDAAMPLWVSGDFVRITQVLTNLLMNAVKFTPVGTGRIRVGMTTDAGRAVITVDDNGVGIPAPMLDSIFDMFAQIRGHTGSAQQGLGIGLALSRRMVELHHGEIRAYSGGQGLGTSMQVRLPTVLPPPRSEPAGGTGCDHRALRAAVRVLVVDDSEDGAESLAALLRIAGCSTEVAGDGRAALDVVEAFAPDVVLLDIGLPDMDGYELAQRLRKLPACRASRFVAITGWGAQSDVAKARAAGIDFHRTKPIDFDDLLELISRAP